MLKNHLITLKIVFSNVFWKEIFFFFTTYKHKKLSLEEENIIEDIRNLFRLKNELNYTAIKDIRNVFRLIRNLFRLEKETKEIILRDIKNIFEHEEEENYYNPVKVSNFWSNIYIEYGSNSDGNKTLSFEEYFNKIKPYLKDHK